MNTFSQSERGIGNITSLELELTEAKDKIDLLQKYVIKIKDSLRNCRNPHSEIDSETLLNTGKYYALIIAVQDYKNDKNFRDLEYTIRDGRALKKGHRTAGESHYNTKTGPKKPPDPSTRAPLRRPVGIKPVISPKSTGKSGQIRPQ